MRQVMTNRAALIAPFDPKKDQVDETRRVLKEMNQKVDRIIDEQVARSTRMT